MINQVQGSGITTEQQKKTWLINWYFANDPMGSIYLATLRNPSIVASYQTSPGLLYGSTFTQSMENYFIKIKNHFGQSMFDQLVTEFAQQSNLYVDEIKVDEWHMYGCSDALHGVDSKRVARDLNLDNQITSNEYVIETPEEVTYLFSSYQLERGAKRYELSNHLGNVLTVISDKKTAVFTGTSFNYFAAERISATDYSPFGAPLASRSWNGGEYRFGFNGKENDNEVKGNGTQQDYGMRIHDTRLGRFLSVDPLAKDFAWNSTFSFAENSPIECLDLDGGEKLKYTGIKLNCPTFDNYSPKKQRKWPHISIFRSETVRQQAQIYNRTVTIIEPEPGAKTKETVSIGNSDQTTISYDMYKNSDNLEVFSKPNERIYNTDNVTGTGSFLVDTKYKKLILSVTPSGNEEGSEYTINIRYNDVRVFEKKNYFIFGIKVWSSKVKMLTAGESKAAILNDKKREIPQIENSDTFKTKFEANENINQQEDYFQKDKNQLKPKYE